MDQRTCRASRPPLFLPFESCVRGRGSPEKPGKIVLNKIARRLAIARGGSALPARPPDPPPSPSVHEGNPTKPGSIAICLGVIVLPSHVILWRPGKSVFARGQNCFRPNYIIRPRCHTPSPSSHPPCHEQRSLRAREFSPRPHRCST